MADELSQSDFDKTIEKLKTDIELAGDGVERAVEDQSVILERIISRSVKSMLAGAVETTELLQTVVVAQQEVQQEQIEEQEDQSKKNIFLLTNMANALQGLLVLGFKGKLSETSREREEKRTSDALLGVLSDLGSGLSNIKDGLLDALKLATNPLGLIGAIVGISIGVVAGVFTLISTKLNLPGLIRGLGRAIAVLFSPRSKLGKAIVAAVKSLGVRIASFVKTFGQVGASILKQIPLVKKLFAFMTPFIKFGRVLSKAFLPLTIAIAVFQGVRGAIKDVKEGGDALSATLAGLGEILDFLTFGLLDTKLLKKTFEEPIRTFIEGIKELFTDGFSINTLKKIFVPLLKFMFVLFPEIVIKASGKLLAIVADALGFKDFATDLKAFLADFDLVKFFTDGIQAMIDFFVGIPAALAQLPEILISISDSIINSVKSVFNKFIDDPLGTIKEIGEAIVDMFSKLVDGVVGFVIDIIPARLLSDDLKAVKERRKTEKEDAKKLAALKEKFGVDTLEEVEAESQRLAKLAGLTKRQKSVAIAFDEALRTGDKQAQASLIQLSNQIRDEIAALPPAIQPAPPIRLDELNINPPTTSALVLAEQMVVNAKLRDRAAAPTVISPVSSSTVVQQGGSQAIPIIAPVSLRNGENTLRRVMDGDFRGAMPR